MTNQTTLAKIRHVHLLLKYVNTQKQLFMKDFSETLKRHDVPSFMFKKLID